MWAPLSVLGRHMEHLMEPPTRPSVLVIGSGWGAHAFVGALDRRHYRVQVLSPTGVRLNQPSLIHNFPNFQPPSSQFSPRVPQIEDVAIQLQEHEKQVTGHKGTYSYDYLVIATGSEAFDFNVKGVRENCLMCKTAEDMKRIHAAVQTKKSALILGAGPTGLELACKLKSEGIQVRILEATSTILPGFSEPMRQRVTAYLSNLELPIQLNSPVRSVTKDQIVLTNGSINTNDYTLVWTCGIRPPPFVRQLTGGAPLTVDPFLCYKKEIYGLGDSVKGYPPTAQNAKQQGLWLAYYFNARFQSPPYQYTERGRVLDLTYAIFIEYKGIIWHIPYFLTPLVRWALKQ